MKEYEEHIFNQIRDSLTMCQVGHYDMDGVSEQYLPLVTIRENTVKQLNMYST